MFQKPDRYSIGYGVKAVYKFKCFPSGHEYTNGLSSFRRIRRGLKRNVYRLARFSEYDKVYIFFNHLKNKKLRLWK